jgi:hypothetical protein
MDSVINETARTLAAEYEMKVSVDVVAHPDGSVSYSVSGGEHRPDDSRKEWEFGSGATVEEAAFNFKEKRQARRLLDPLDSLKKQAAKHGLDLVPAARPLDLETSTAAEG